MRGSFAAVRSSRGQTLSNSLPWTDEHLRASGEASIFRSTPCKFATNCPTTGLRGPDKRTSPPKFFFMQSSKSIVPAEADAPLLVDPDSQLAMPVAFKGFQAVGRGISGSSKNGSSAAHMAFATIHIASSVVHIVSHPVNVGSAVGNIASGLVHIDSRLVHIGSGPVHVHFGLLHIHFDPVHIDFRPRI